MTEPGLQTGARAMVALSGGVEVTRARSAESGETQRQLRVGEQVRHVLAELLMRGDVHDPVLANASLTVTEVRMSRDLRRATVFLTEFGGGLRAETQAALERTAPFLRGEIARRMHLKYAPDLLFRLDSSFEEAARVDRLLAIERARLQRQHEDEDEPR